MRLQPSKRPFLGEVELPISKSIANRYLIISAICGKSLKLPHELPVDVQILQDALSSEVEEINIGMAGTAMRFLTAFFAIQEGKTVVLTGDDRMKKRPISALVEALKSLGAEIEYLENDGFPPLKVSGRKMVGGEVTISGTVSSQFISALMMIAPTMENGLRIKLQGDVLSKPYIELTASCMRNCGAEVDFRESTILINPGEYQIPEMSIESDWSAASYFYALACSKPGSKLLLKGLKLDSSQGDSILANWFEPLGVSSTQKENGVQISSHGVEDFPATMDFQNNPDLAQTLAFLAAALGETLEQTGLDNLRIKETDRIAALKYELEKLGVAVVVSENAMEVSGRLSIQEAQISTYNDHRMAMSAAVVSSQIPITIENPDVVAKSFPNFWSELKNVSS